MPTPPFVVVSYPGVNNVVSCMAYLAHGITPSIMRITTGEQNVFEPVEGDLVISQSDRAPIVFKNCRVIDHALEFPDSNTPRSWKISLADRRWKWSFSGIRGPLFGHYNVKRIDGKVDFINYQEKTPQELATLCLEAMGEVGYDVSDMPNDSRPLVEWEGELPAEALQDLCDLLNCVIVLQNNDTVAIRERGKGLRIFVDDTTISASGTIDPPEKPDAVAVVCGKTRYQIRCQLEAVGLDHGEGREADRIKPISALSYKPADGWTKLTAGFPDVIDADAKLQTEKRALAERTVYKWYRLKIANPDGSFPLKVTGYGDVYSLHQILPIEDIDCVLTLNADDTLTVKPPEVFGSFFKLLYLGDTSDIYVNTSSTTRYNKPFRVNRELGIIEFQEQVYQLYDPGTGPAPPYTREPAEINIRIAASIRHFDQRHYERLIRFKPTGGSRTYNTGSRVLLHDEIVWSIWDLTQANNGNEGRQDDNRLDIYPEIDHYIDSAIAEYQVRTPESITYGGIFPYNPDGAIWQVVWEVSSRGFTTQVSRNTEHHPIIVSYRERRFIEKLKKQRMREAENQMQWIRKQKIRPNSVLGGGAYGPT